MNIIKYFKSKHLNTGRTGALLSEKSWDIDRVNSMVNGFRDSECFELVMAAMNDYSDFVDKQIRDVDVNKESYQRVIPALLVKKDFPIWFKNFINDLKSFHASSNDKGAGLKKKYL